jgi:hypothetical protein
MPVRFVCFQRQNALKDAPKGGVRPMRIPIHAVIAVSIALMPVGYSQAAKRIHNSRKTYSSRGIQNPPRHGSSGGNAAAEGNNANSMSGSNSAVENANGRTNCC